MYKKRDLIYIFLFLTLALALWTGLSFFPGPTYVVLPMGVQGSHNLTNLDLDNSVYRLSQMWDAWPEQLHQPDELDAAEAPIPYTTINHSQISFATYRVYLTLMPGVTYGIAQRSSDYAMRLFMDGEEIVTVGNPGATEAENVPQVRDVVYYFTPQRDTVELVVQSSNYVHFRDGTKAPAFIFGTAGNIARYVGNQTLKNGIIFGCLLVAFLYHFAIFLLNRHQRTSLLFSILCLTMTFSTAQSFIRLLPDYNWLLLFRVEYLCTLAAGAALVLLVHTLFPGSVHRWVLRVFLVFCGGYLAIILLTHPMFFSRVLAVFQAGLVAVIGYLLVRLAMRLREKQRKNILAFLGFALFGLSAVYDILRRNSLTSLLDIGGVQIFDAASGMVLLVCCYALVVSIDQAEVNRRLEEAGIALADAEARYGHLLAQARQNVRDSEPPPVTLTDFGLTKRETEVAFLLLDGKSREEIAGVLCISMGTVNSHCTNLYRKVGVASANEFFARVRSNRENEEKN